MNRVKIQQELLEFIRSQKEKTRNEGKTKVNIYFDKIVKKYGINKKIFKTLETKSDFMYELEIVAEITDFILDERNKLEKSFRIKLKRFLIFQKEICKSGFYSWLLLFIPLLFISDFNLNKVLNVFFITTGISSCLESYLNIDIRDFSRKGWNKILNRGIEKYLFILIFLLQSILLLTSYFDFNIILKFLFD